MRPITVSLDIPPVDIGFFWYIANYSSTKDDEVKLIRYFLFHFQLGFTEYITFTHSFAAKCV